MSRKSKHDYKALGIEYDQRRAADESTDSIKTDFAERGINWGTFWNNKKKPAKTAGTTVKKETRAKAKVSDTETEGRQEKSFPIPLQNIIADPEIQQRVHMTPSLIDEYVELMTDSETLPPVVVFGPTDNDRYYLSEGFHRYEATKKMGFMSIPVEIRPGGYDEALDYACEANTKHGLRPSQADRMKAVETQLMKWPERTSRDIARKCGVSQTTVAQRRITHINTDIVDHPERKDREIAQQWGVKPEYVGEHRILLLKKELEAYPNTPDDKLSEDFGVSLETVTALRAELYPPQAEEPPADSWKPVQMDTSHKSSGQDTSMSSNHETTVHLDTPHELTPESKEPSDPVSATEPPVVGPPQKTLERALELYTILDQESYSIQTILNAVQEAGGYEVFVNALDSSQRVALLAKMTVALRELAAFHQSFETLVNGPVMTPSIRDATLQAITEANEADKAMERDPEEIE